MKKVAILLCLCFVCSVTFLYAEEKSLFDPPTVPKASSIKKMNGKIDSVDTVKNVFKLVPNNVGMPITVTCKKDSDCKAGDVIANSMVTAEVYYENGQWWGVSVKPQEVVPPPAPEKK